MNGGPVSVATDVYALGLMLFELLTDQPAFADRHRGAPSDDTPQPSRRSTDPSLRHALAGDLDAIVGQALQPAPEARYASVAALADDLARHRRHQPISARRITRWAQAAKFVRRHRLPVALSAALGGVALVGVVGIAWQAQEARTQARRAESVKDFLLGVFNAADPRLAGGKPDGQTTAKTLLDRSAARIDERFAADPELRIELLRTAADIYRELGEDAAHDALRARQLALVRQHFGPLHDNLIDAPIEQALHAYQQGDMAACRARLAEADALIRRAGRERSEQRAQWWLADSQCHRDQPHQAARRLASLEKAEALFAQLAPGQRGHITAWSELAVEHSGQMRLPQALAANQRAIDMAERWPGRNEAELQTFHANRGITLQQGGDLAGAALALGRAADIAERTSGADFRTAWLLRSRQARTLHLSGDRAGAAPLFDALLARLPPPEKAVPDASTAREEIGERLAAEGRPQAGLPLLQAAERGFLQAANQEFDLRRARRHLGDALARLGRADEARQVFQLALQDFEAHEAAASTQPLAAMRERWGRFLLDQGETAAARAQWQRVLDEAAVPTWAHVALAQAGLARAALADGNTAAAQQFAHQSQATWDRLTGFRDVRMQAYLWRVQAHVLAHAGQPLAADGLRAQALAAARRTDAPDSPTLTQAGYLGL